MSVTIDGYESIPVIGVFDSGVGGLTVVKELKRAIPTVPLIYFGDTARTPYGTKSQETIKRFALEDTKFLLSKGANIIVIACHSAASVATSMLNERFDCPIFEVITPSVSQLLRLSRRGRIGVIGTRATIESGVYEREIKKRADYVVIGVPCPLLVPLVEEGWLKRRETKMIVKKYIHPLKLKNIDTLILGCTHYPMLKDVIARKAGKRIKIIDPSKEVAITVRDFIFNKIGVEDYSIGDYMDDMDRDKFYFSDLGSVTKEVIRRFIDRPIDPKKVVLRYN